jgi:hypothetical protein
MSPVCPTSPIAPQLAFDFFAVKPINADWLVSLLKDKGWVRASDILLQIGAPDTDTGRRQLRATAEASEGRVASGQLGYKLFEHMTKAEFDHFCAWMLSQAGKMQLRVTQVQKVFYARHPVPA